MYLFGAIPSEYDAESLRSPDSITPRRNLGFVQSSCDFVKLEPVGAQTSWYGASWRMASDR